MARRHDFWTAQLSLKISTIWGNVSGSGISPHCKDTMPKTFKKLFPEKELRRHSPNLHIDVYVSDLTHDRFAYYAAGNMWTYPGNI